MRDDASAPQDGTPARDDTGTAPDRPAGNEPGPRLAVSVHPARVARAATGKPRTPSEALRLAGDPERAGFAARGNPPQRLPGPVAPLPPPPARDDDASPAPPAPGWWRRLLSFVRRGS